MGTPKQLLPLGGKPAISLCLEALADGGLRDVVVVLGHRGDEVAEAIKGAPVKIVRNENPGGEMAESVRLGLARVEASPTAVVVHLVDHPLVRPETVGALLSAHAENPGRILIPKYKGKRGHPALFPREYLYGLERGLNLREIIRDRADKVLDVDVDDEGVVLDMDTEADYRAMAGRISDAEGQKA